MGKGREESTDINGVKEKKSWGWWSSFNIKETGRKGEGHGDGEKIGMERHVCEKRQNMKWTGKGKKERVRDGNTREIIFSMQPNQKCARKSTSDDRIPNMINILLHFHIYVDIWRLTVTLANEDVFHLIFNGHYIHVASPPPWNHDKFLLKPLGFSLLVLFCNVQAPSIVLCLFRWSLW